jgi:hypothetical protein
VRALAARHGYTVRELIRALAGGGGHRVIVGTPEQIADDIEHWFRAGAADGFNLMPDVLPGGLEDFVDGVVPLLRQRGIFRHAYEGRTLREHLGLARPRRGARPGCKRPEISPPPRPCLRGPPAVAGRAALFLSCPDPPPHAMKRRSLLAGSSTALASTLFPAALAASWAWAPSPGRKAALRPPRPVSGGVLKVAVSPEPTLLTSAFITTMNIGQVSSKVLEGLVSFDLNLQPVPALATSWQQSEDGLTLRFKLRENVKWHDGHDFSAADVEYTLLNVWKKLHPFGRAAFANVEKVETPDPTRW